jgi:hypothetical protein
MPKHMATATTEGTGKRGTPRDRGMRSKRI